MSKADFSTVAGIKAEIASIAKAGKTLDGRIQRCAVAAFEHMLAHRDHTLLVELYQALSKSKGLRRASMAAWIMQFTQLTANTDAASKAAKPFVLDKEKSFDLEGAKETMWYECGKPEAAPDKLLDVNKAVMSLLNKVKAAKEAGRPIKGLDAATLAAVNSLGATA